MPTLALVRHGQSLWNQQNRFTGWVDVPLTELGRTRTREAAATRNRMGSTLDEVQGRVDPRQAWSRREPAVRSKVAQVRDTVMGTAHDGADRAGESAVAAFLVGVEDGDGDGVARRGHAGALAQGLVGLDTRGHGVGVGSVDVTVARTTVRSAEACFRPSVPFSAIA